MTKSYSKTPIAIALFAAGIVSATAVASSHREAPNITRFPTLDSTDFYLFNSYESGRGDYVTAIANYIPLQDAYGGPNYFAMDPAAVYAIHFDSDGDAQEDLTFEFRFNNSLPNGGVMLPVGPEGMQRNVSVPLKFVGGISASDQSALNFNEMYSIELVEGPQRTGMSTQVTGASGEQEFTKPIAFVGEKTFGSAQSYEDYANQYVYEIQVPNCSMPGRVFVGQRKDPFVVNLGETFDLVNYVPIESSAFPGGIEQSDANDDLRNKNVNTIALELPKDCVTGDGNGVVGSWTTAQVPQARLQNPNATIDTPEVNGGALVQVSRLGSPLVNELVIGIDDKDTFSSASPSEDGQFADYVTHPTLPVILDLLFKDPVNATLGTDFASLAPSNYPRTDLVAAFLTGFAGVNQQAMVTPSEMLRLNTAIPATPAAEQSAFGVAGDDLAGFPNGRRPGDDVVDIALRVVMGALCHDIPVNGEPTNLGFCSPSDAPVGNVPFTDGAPINASYVDDGFPYLQTPVPGSSSE
ncbi:MULTISPECIES: DUF4331 domain-containing protein [Gammaproteobacteria]|uniref:DUF4331 domain-containing protein n=1 Tax=Gammaproteobacteria TaxID=1236 RepID=UPI000DCF8F10|nr:MULTISPECIES: DUF4331 domain-containing protein [Gammaproteobacteria]RTE86589.1 DUF4331 domain-containing protein [Aliidiomarina sp. B3213]TCZ90856.1 DUF4331 domain-containing protein [Lysobacter sp. N42]